MNKIKIGIIGTGVGLRTYFPGFSKFANAEIVAIAGSSLNRSKEFAEKYGIPLACRDYKELCEIPELDLVCVTAPNRFHVEMVQYAMRFNKNIICEKPVSENKKEIEELEALAKNYKKILVVDHQLRYNPYMTRIKSILDNNEIGKPYLVKINQEGVAFAKKDVKWSWSFDGKQGGGVRLAMASHFNDLIQYWFGNKKIMQVSGNLNPVFKKRIDAAGAERDVDASTICSAKIDLQDELSLMYTINAGAYRKFIFEIDIYGDKGQLHFDLENKLSLYSQDNIGVGNIVDVEGVFDDEKENKASLFSGSFRYFAPKIVEAIRTGEHKLIDRSARISDAIYNSTLLDAIQQSANSGKSIVFNKKENNYV